jgi:hypothetical protein
MEKIKYIIDTIKLWAHTNPNKAIFAFGFGIGFLIGAFIL